MYGGEGVKWSAIQVSQWTVSVVREQAWAGALEGFHLKENVKYSLKQFSKTKDRKEPHLTPPGKAHTDQTGVTAQPATALLPLPPVPGVLGLSNTLEAACEEHE